MLSHFIHLCLGVYEGQFIKVTVLELSLHTHFSKT